MKKAADIKNLQNAERDLNTLFQQEGLSLPIKPTFVTFGLQDVPYLSLATWYSYLLGSHPHLVLGGFSTNDWNASLLLDSFWKNFQCTAPDHAVFDLHGGGNRLSRCLPFMLHLDEGVGLRKSAVLVLSMQPLFGRETAERYVAYRHEKDIHLCMTMAMFHNCMGSTFLSRFLFTVMSKKMYSGKNTGTYWGMLDILAEECKELMTNGVTINNDTWYPVCLGIKGDQPALIKCGNFKRSFMNLGRNKGCCWECLAGYDNIPFEDIHDGAAWEGTIGLVDPWPATSPSPLLKIPSYSSNPTLFWKRDPFHAFKQTIGGHFAASLIIFCTVDCGLWKADGLSSSVDEMLGRAFYDFRFWVWHEWRGSVVNHIKSFTRQILHFKDHGSFPSARFKGSDQMIIIRWLRHLILHGPVLESHVTRGDLNLVNSPPQAWQSDFFLAALRGCDGGIRFFHNLHRQGVWLGEVAKDMHDDCSTFCTSYYRLAVLSHQHGLARFHLEPSLHTFCHFKVELSPTTSSEKTLKMSPACSTTEADEDFVGKICKLSRHVHACTVSKRCIERYLVHCYFAFGKDGKVWRTWKQNSDQLKHWPPLFKKNLSLLLELKKPLLELILHHLFSPFSILIVFYLMVLPFPCLASWQKLVTFTAVDIAAVVCKFQLKLRVAHQRWSNGNSRSNPYGAKTSLVGSHCVFIIWIKTVKDLFLIPVTFFFWKDWNKRPKSKGSK